MGRLRVAGLASVLMSTAAFAQADRTGTGGGPLSTERAENVTTTAQTKPPSREASPTAHGNINRRTKNDEEQDRLSSGICIGCNAH